MSILEVALFLILLVNASMGTLGGQSEILETIDPSPLDESSNVLQGWSKRWKNDMLGWHLSDVHPVLRKYLATVQSSLQQQQQQQHY
mmetsp:Transcript_19602/g.28809  ORF Transcript_19602/g.28809 Transcript_19602/m.28809 type:complete len:87 (+) Transcript_19602:107-367(+)